MSELVLTPSLEEFEAFQRFLERSYGHSRNFFLRYNPHINRPEPEALDCSLIVKQDGEIVSHVGVYPLDIAALGARLQTGGIGAVATAPHGRGQGHMTRLMSAALNHMRQRGDVLAVLWGDRQRYRHFGYESCGFKWSMTFTRRSLQKAMVEPVPVDEVDPTDENVIKKIQEFHSQLHFRVERPWMSLLLRKEGIRIFLADEGYVIARGERRELRVEDVVSPRGQEARLLAGVLSFTHSPSATADVMPRESTGTGSLMEAANRWTILPQGMFRIVDWPGLALALYPLLLDNVRHLAPFGIAVTCKDVDRAETVTFSWDGSTMEIAPGLHSKTVVELDQRMLVAKLLGSPFVGPESLGPLEMLLPVPLHISLLDHV